MKKACIFIFGVFLLACSKQHKELPYLGRHDVNATGDTVYHRIPDFSFVTQDGDTLTQADVEGKVYIADFFFSTCPTICPLMKTQMLRIYERYRGNDSLMILSHSINPRYDTPGVLKQYKQKLGIESAQWQFLTGTHTDVYKLAQNSYLTSALEDSSAVDEGGFIHSGAFVLIDKDRHIRAIYDGTKEKEVDKLMADIDRLLHIR